LEEGVFLVDKKNKKEYNNNVHNSSFCLLVKGLIRKFDKPFNFSIL